MVDTALTQRGATVAQLDLTDLAMRELVTVFHGCAAAVISAELRPASQRLRIDTAGEPLMVSTESTEVLRLGLSELHVKQHSLRCRLMIGDVER